MRTWITLTAMSLAGVAAAQGIEMAKAASDSREAIKRGDYFAAYRLLADHAFDTQGKPTDFSSYQMWQQLTPMVTGELPLDALGRGQPLAPDNEAAAQVRTATPRPAIAEIVRRAKATSIVILNEAHYSPRDRAFGLEVARALRPLGYRYLAVETFNQGPVPGTSPAIKRLIADRAVTRATGFYTRDPVFARYVDEAMRIGYVPVAYESTLAQNARGAGVQSREDGQAENLKALLNTTPGAKLLIHVGHGHNAEGPLTDGGTQTYMMAGRLKAITGIDPLTINQTILTDLQPRYREAYRIAATKANGRDVILFTGDRPLLVGKGGTDLQVVHPARSYRYGRPTWLAALGGRPVAISPALLPKTGERLIQAFAADAPADAVPLDQVLVTAGKPVPSLMLPRGVRVRYAVQPDQR